jgi:hypothetical protein
VAKVGLEQGRDGGALTVAIGPCAKIGPAEFDSEFHMTIASHRGGTDIDAGWRVGPKFGNNSSQMEDIAILKSVAPRRALPTFQPPDIQ